MSIKLEPFIQGFMTAIRPQLTPQDRELLALIFKGYIPYTHSSRDELNPAKAVHYFRLRHSHFNVLLPAWILNGRQSNKSDRFKIGFTDDHSIIFDSRESIIYDPTSEALHAQSEYRPFLSSTDWHQETWSLLKDELAQRRLHFCSLTERIEQIPGLYEGFLGFIARYRLKAKVKDLRDGLDLSAHQKDVLAFTARERLVSEMAMDELWRRYHGRAA